MASYKLVYFNVMGLGEPIRFLLSYGGVEFQDIRINHSSEEWSNMKSSIPFFTLFPYEFHDLQLYFNVFSATPFGQLPTLEINGKVYSQTLPICRYLAKQFNLLGKTDLDTLQIDAIASALYDFRRRKYWFRTYEQIDFLSNDILLWITFTLVTWSISFPFSFQWQYRLIIESLIQFWKPKRKST